MPWPSSVTGWILIIVDTDHRSLSTASDVPPPAASLVSRRIWFFLANIARGARSSESFP